MTVPERLARYLGRAPSIASSAFVAPNATVIGDVTLGAHSSVWYGSVLRGDINSIVIGEGTNVQDGTIVHLADDHGVRVGNYTTIGHAAIIHACDIGHECLIGMGATVLGRIADWRPLHRGSQRTRDPAVRGATRIDDPGCSRESRAPADRGRIPWTAGMGGKICRGGKGALGPRPVSGRTWPE